jgi:hypothetical protein
MKQPLETPSEPAPERLLKRRRRPDVDPAGVVPNAPRDAPQQSRYPSSVVYSSSPQSTSHPALLNRNGSIYTAENCLGPFNTPASATLGLPSPQSPRITRTAPVPASLYTRLGSASHSTVSRSSCFPHISTPLLWQLLGNVNEKKTEPSQPAPERGAGRLSSPTAMSLGSLGSVMAQNSQVSMASGPELAEISTNVSPQNLSGMSNHSLATWISRHKWRRKGQNSRKVAFQCPSA